MKIKALLVVVALLALVGCGIPQQVSNNCGGDLDIVCDAILGQDDRSDELEDQVDVLNSQYGDLDLENNNLTVSIDLIEAQMDELEADVLENKIAIAEEQSMAKVVALIDPCGPSGGFDEIIIELSNGDLVAYFRQNGSRQFLTILSDGQYRTTDAQRCRFEVVDGEYREI